ncbi:MAG: SusC/RagA family TonB-linked outer membrane protein [Bacteroidota bacterium]
MLLVCLGSMHLLAQSISGKVTDSKKEPLIGAAISIEGTSKGVATDLDGNYRITGLESKNYVVIISALGYTKQKKNVDLTSGSDKILDIELLDDALQLDQVVVVGYGLEQKRDVTGSISTIKAKDINNTVQPSFEQAMQGRAAGVQVTAASGMAGSPVKINIRGSNSISAGSQPLYVIDGIPITTGDFSPGNLGSRTNALADINPADIESMEILKDAAAAAIYGSRGANGVVLITTKKGKAGKTKFDAGYAYGVLSPTNVLRYTTATELLSLRDKASIELNDSAESKKAQIGWWNNKPFTRAQADSFVAATGGSDWINATLRTGRLQQANLSASGGNEKTTFYIGGTYRKEDGFLVGNSFERTNGKIAIENKAYENLSIGINSNLSYSINNRVPTGSDGGFGLAQLKLPYIPIYNSDGSFNDPRGNPLWQLQNRRFAARVFRAISEVHAEWRIIKGLNFRSSFGTDFLNQNEEEFNFRNVQSLDTAEVSNAWDRRTTVLNWTNTNYFNYTLKIKEKHDITFLLGNEVQRSNRNGVGLYGEKFPNDYFTEPGDAAIKRGYSYTTGWSFASFFSRVNYKLKDKYLFSASMRYDGSSRFGANNKWGAFPGVSAGWILSEEAFIKKIKAISFLKLRASYGQTGNANIGDFAALGFYSSSTGYNGNSAIVPNTLSNDNLSWEKSNQVDVNLDIAFLKNRFAAGFNYYYKTSNDLLLNISVPTSSGYALILQNRGRLENKGFEITLNTKNVEGKFTWYTDFNIAFNRNKVLDVDGLKPDAFDDKDLGNRGGEGRVIEGYPVGQFYVVEWAGVQQQEGSIQLWNSDGSPKLDASGQPVFVNVPAGTELFKDRNGNIMTFANPTGGEFYGDNRRAIGNPLPKFIGGITNTFSYGGFELSVLFNFVYGNQIYDDAAKTQIGGFNNINQRPDILNAYTQGNPSTEVPSLYNNSGSTNPSSDYVAINSSRWLYDASYIRLRSLTFSYSFKEEFCQKIKLSNLKLFINGGNLLTYTKFPGMDPEVLRNIDPDSERGNIAFGGPYLGTPQAKTITAGINIKF